MLFSIAILFPGTVNIIGKGNIICVCKNYINIIIKSIVLYIILYFTNNFKYTIYNVR